MDEEVDVEEDDEEDVDSWGTHLSCCHLVKVVLCCSKRLNITDWIREEMDWELQLM